jgi:hypothetical protein
MVVVVVITRKGWVPNGRLKKERGKHNHLLLRNKKGTGQASLIPRLHRSIYK